MKCVAHYRPGCATQRGVAGMMAMIFLLVVVAFSAVTLLSMSTSDLHDTTAQNDGVAALFLAESGIERASRLYSTGGTAACSGPPSTMQQPVTNFPRGSIEPHLDPITSLPTPPTPLTLPARCQIEVLGRVGNTTRTIQADLERGPALSDIVALGGSQGATTTSNTLAWNHNILPGAASNRIIVVGVAIRQNGAGQTVQIGAQTTYNGVPMTSAGAVTDAVNGLRIEWLYKLDPPIGGNPPIRVRLSSPARAVAVSMAFSGVNQVSPIDAVSAPPPSCTGNSGNALCNVTTLTNKARVVDMLAARLPTIATVAAGQTLGQSLTVGAGNNNSLRGAGSYRTASTLTAAVVSMGWTLTPGTTGWLQSALALRPNPITHVMRWTEL